MRKVIKKIGKWWLFGAGILSISLLGGCGKKETPVEIGNREQILHMGNGVEPEDLDPQIVSGVQENKILIGLFEGLVNPDAKDFHPIPGVAKSWDISEDRLIYTFYLREDAKWSNGDQVTADDFVFSAKRMLSRNLGSPYSYLFFHIDGGEKFYAGENKDFSDVGIKALDKQTLEIRLNKPTVYFLALLVHMSWYPVHKETILKHGKIDERGTGWTRAGNMVSNGPFKLKEWKIGSKIIVEKNPSYWSYNEVKLNEIHFHPISDQNTEERAFRTGHLHITNTIPLPMIESYLGKKELRISPYFSTYAYVFNVNKAPFNDFRVRQAFSLALDRKSIIKNVSKRNEDPAYSFVPQYAGYHTSAHTDENVEKAKELLNEAGFPDGKGFPPVTLMYNTSDAHKSTAEALQHMWKKHLNIHVELVNQEWKVYLMERKSDKFNLIRFGWVGDYLDPNAFFEIFTSYSGNNISGWKNAEYDDYIKLADNTTDPEKRLEIFDKAENLLMKELPVLPIFFWNSAYLVNQSVKNLYPNLLDLHPYNSIYLEAEK